MGPLEQLEAAVAQHVAAIKRTAAASIAGGGPAWDALMRHYGQAPFDAQERAAIVAGMRLGGGAVPAEVRVLFVGLEQWADAELRRLAQDPSLAASPALSALAERLRGLADRETSSYERALGLPPPAPAPVPLPAPAGPSLASIFQNAQETSKEVPWAGMKYKNVGALTCVHCGGPQERPSDFMCKYCRRPIAGSIKPTT